MKYLKFFIRKLIKIARGITIKLFTFIILILIMVATFLMDGYTLEDIGIESINLNPNDYCNLTDVNYTAILHDNPTRKANVLITEYLTFDVHASSKSNPFKELWRELPEDVVDGLKVTYDVLSVAQILADGTEIPYTETPKMYWEDYDYTKSSTMYWHHSNGSGMYPDNDESLLIYIPWTYREKMTFKIVYSMNNAALKYKDCSELYLSMYSGNTIKKLNSYKAQILIPDKLMPTSYYAYSFGTANSRIPFTESDSKNSGYHTFAIDLDKSDLKFNYHDRYIEFCLLAYGKDKHIFTKYAPNNKYSYENALDECIKENEYYTTKTQRFKTYKTILLLTSFILSILIVLNAKRKYNKTKEKYTFYKPEIEYKYFRDIPSDLDPLFASELVFMKDPFNENKEKQEEYAAILLSLTKKEYIKITKLVETEDWTPKNTLITLEPVYTDYTVSDDSSQELTYISINRNTNQTLKPLSTSERLYLQLLERHCRFAYNSISLYNLQEKIYNDFEYTKSFVKDIEKKPALENGVMLGYFQQSDYDLPKKTITKIANRSLILSLILLFAFNTISYFTPMSFSFGAYTVLGLVLLWKYIYLTSKAGNLVLLTQLGVNEQAKWRGLYNFLNSDTLINEKNITDLPLWENYLIYATAFGISEKVVKNIKIHASELNIDNSPILNHNCYIHSTHFHNSSRLLGRSIHTPSRGGGFGGHGYGGGGRRRRWRWRRPLINKNPKYSFYEYLGFFI